MLDGRGATGMADESSPCSWSKCVGGLSLCGTQVILVVSKFATWLTTVIRIDFDMMSTTAAACSWMTDGSAEQALLTV